jgi:hypothetical protein
MTNTIDIQHRKPIYWVTMNDKFLNDKFVIECYTEKQADTIYWAAQNRPEMKYVNICVRKPSNDRNFKDFYSLGGSWTDDYKYTTEEESYQEYLHYLWREVEINESIEALSFYSWSQLEVVS